VDDLLFGRKHWLNLLNFLDPPSSSGSSARTGSAATDAGSPLSGCLRVPALDLGTEPEHWAATAEVDDRTWHVGIARLILADRVALGESEDLCNVMSIDEIVDEYSTGHGEQTTPVTG
jgi:hypothetical protein